MLERKLPTVKKKPIVKSRTEIAQGLMLSIKAPRVIIGRSHWVLLAKFNGLVSAA